MFTEATKKGPDYVCICCNRLIYHKTVQVFANSKCSKHLGIYFSGLEEVQQIYKTFDCALRQGKYPAEAIANILSWMMYQSNYKICTH